jgi:peptide/nickel transport system permease protein
LIKRLFKNPLFLIGFIFTSVLFTSSVLYQLIGHDKIPEKIFYSREGRIIGTAPLSPAQAPPLGTDKRGHNLAAMLLIGAKYTLGITVVVTVTRMLFSFLFGWLYGMYLTRYQKTLTRFFDGVNFVPMTLLAYVILFPILEGNGFYGTFKYSIVERQIIEIIILVMIGIPTISIEVGNKICEIKEHEFINSAKVLGANRVQIFWREILPHLAPHLSIVSIQQAIQVLLLLVHLGVLNLFFGGTQVFMQLNGEREYESVSNEWSGLLGLYHDQYMTNPWLFIAPVAAFTVTIVFCNFILEGTKKAVKVKECITDSKFPDRAVQNVEPDQKDFSFLK